MAQKIATVSTVFAACDRLAAANERWNREDVRNAVGGGGYVVIDPLIKAWRALKPLREVAPTTPAELLHQVAASLETHITGFMGETETRLAESQQVFDATVSELSNQLATLETELNNKDASLQAVAADLSKLTTQLEDTQQSLSEATTDNARLISENDGLKGRIARTESDHKKSIERLTAEAKEHAQAHARERDKASAAHSAALAAQRKELAEAAEQAENRLMVLLDHERQAAKESVAELKDQLDVMRDNTQSMREKGVALEATLRQVTGQNRKLDSDLDEKAAQCSALSTALQEQQARSLTTQREFEAYKETHKISGDLGALQTAVAALQAKLEQRPRE